MSCLCAHICACTARRRARAFTVRRSSSSARTDIPHHADRADYQKATGLEALFGWLYLRDDHARINELFNRMMEDDNAT